MDEPRTAGNELQTDIITGLGAALARLESGTATRDEVLVCLGARDRLKEITREMSGTVDQCVTQWIVENGEIEEGDIRYYVGTSKTTKCTDQKQALGVILEATGGDLDKLVECFASGAFKPGYCKTVLAPDVYGTVFETKEELDLKTGKPKTGLHKVNQAFLPKGR